MREKGSISALCSLIARAWGAPGRRAMDGPAGLGVGRRCHRPEPRRGDPHRAERGPALRDQRAVGPRCPLSSGGVHLPDTTSVPGRAARAILDLARLGGAFAFFVLGGICVGWAGLRLRASGATVTVDNRVIHSPSAGVSNLGPHSPATLKDRKRDGGRPAHA